MDHQWYEWTMMTERWTPEDGFRHGIRMDALVYFFVPSVSNGWQHSPYFFDWTRISNRSREGFSGSLFRCSQCVNRGSQCVNRGSRCEAAMRYFWALPSHWGVERSLVCACFSLVDKLTRLLADLSRSFPFSCLLSCAFHRKRIVVRVAKPPNSGGLAFSVVVL